MSNPTKANVSDWIQEYRDRLARGELGNDCDPTPKPDPSPYPDHWPARFVAIALELNLSRYLRELAALENGELPVTAFYRNALRAYANRKAHRDGLILFGGEGTGKSVTALSVAYSAFQAISSFDFLDAGEFADLWAKQDHNRIGQLKKVGLLIIDEIGDCEDIRGPAFGLMKRTINHRYKNDLPTVLATTQNERDLRIAISHEIVDRFPSALRIGTDGESNRP